MFPSKHYSTLVLSPFYAQLVTAFEPADMRLSFSSLLVCFLGLIGVVSAKSAVGDRILVVLEDGGEKNLYSQFWADLECTPTSLVY